eukprot:TRINITY_DN2074_c0_g1_i2.p1 TRINITY_DN2074_c0_g1~~TRINITY_DN2074_c0_g1_i2.p1  ORF type:complete len:467 (+),score=82.76 TRINITY_DN2074_c0_g1_i2:63-1463(+)
MAAPTRGREVDVIVFGATGDTGVAGCCFLYFKAKNLGVSSWAPAARNLDKLKKDVLDPIKAKMPGPEGVAPSTPSKADSSDYDSLVKMCSRATCVIACAGPFALYGESVVKACVEVGTHYVDVTGEMPWVQKMQKKYGAEAEAKGVCLVCCAGYDSVPPDLTACLSAKALERSGQRLGRFEAFVGGSGGALPTGTLNTVVLMVGAVKSRLLSACTLGLLGRQQSKTPRPEAVADSGVAGSGSSFVAETEKQNLAKNAFWTMIPGYSRLAGQFGIPHFMAPINVYTVHHTACKEGYGGLVYRERMAGLPRGLLSLYGFVPSLLGLCVCFLLGVAMAMPGGLKTFVWLRDKFNPAMQARVRGKLFNGFASTGTTFVHGYGAARDGSGVRVNVSLHSAYDPGIGFTMLSACTVASQLVKLVATEGKAPKGGFNSAAVAVGGDALADALRASGVSVKVEVLQPRGASTKP